MQGSFDDDAVYTELARDAGRVRPSRRARPLDRVFYLSTAPEFFPLIAGKLGAAGLNHAERAAVRIVIEKPFGYDLASARTLNAAAAGGLRGAPDLPDRPLPGQGDRPEPDGAALRQRAVRAGLEPQLHRPRPDHRRRGHRHRRPRRLLRALRRAARPRPEPHAPAAGAADDGAADGVRRRPAARREAQGAGGDRAARASTRWRRWRCAPSTPPAWSAASRSPATARRTACARYSRTADLRGAAPARVQLALGRRARSTCAPASGWRAS